MTDRYRVTHVPHFIGQRLVYPDMGEDSIVTLPPGVKPGRWLQLVEEKAEPAAFPSAPAGGFTIDHISRGDYVVLNADGDRSSVVFKNTGVQGEAKQLAEAEAARLNAGGAIKLEATEPAASSSGQDDPPTGTQTSADDLPDA